MDICYGQTLECYTIAHGKLMTIPCNILRACSDARLGVVR